LIEVSNDKRINRIKEILYENTSEGCTEDGFTGFREIYDGDQELTDLAAKIVVAIET
jgi:hypothetical protein